MSAENNKLGELVSLLKRRGFVFPGSDIYGGLSGTWDWGHLGVLLKERIKNEWHKMFVREREDMVTLDAALIMNAEVWKASGHVEGFSDPLVACEKCKRRFRADQIIPTLGVGIGPHCPECGGPLSEPRQFNMMFETRIGAAEDSSSVAYLRPETAQGIFVNFKNTLDAYHPKLHFGIAQIGKAFRNEITPRDFLFRAREFEQMEIEYFVRPKEWEEHFERWRMLLHGWVARIGIPESAVHEVEVPDGERAHYSRRTIDFEYDFPFGRKELYGLAYRGDYDLAQHSERSGVDLSYSDEVTGERFIPHVIEPSLGLDRTALAVLASAYAEDELGATVAGGASEKRTVLRLPPALAPISAAVFPLLKNKPELVARAREIYRALVPALPAVMFDDNGNIGKRYRRQDEIGTPWCITVDFDTLADGTVTLRDRDSGVQTRIPAEEIVAAIQTSL